MANPTNVTALLHMNGVDGSTTFADVIGSTWTATSATISTTQAKFGGASGKFNGSSAYVSRTQVANDLLGNVDFTVEAWVSPTSIKQQKIVGIWADTSGFGFSWKLELDGSNRLQFLYSTTGGNGFSTTGATAIGLSTTALLHMDGSNGSTTFTDDLGTAWAATNATISTTQSKFGGAAGSFNGSSTYVSHTQIANDLLSNVDFTVEAWIYPTSTKAQKIVGIWSDTTGSGFSWKLELTSANKLQFTYSTTGGNGLSTTGATAIGLNAWTHIAVTRTGGFIYLWLNGVNDNTPLSIGTTAFFATSGRVMEIGRDGAGATNYFAGYIDELRISRTALYTGTFTPPVAAFQWLNTWTHVAVTRTGGFIYLWLNGVNDNTPLSVGSTSFFATSGKAIEIGRDGAGTTNFFAGYIDDVRITRTVALYTGTFTPPTTEFPDFDPFGSNFYATPIPAYRTRSQVPQVHPNLLFTTLSFVAHPSSGTLTGTGSAIAGVSRRTYLHTSSGALSAAGPGAAVAATAHRTRTHAVSGVLTGTSGTIAATATRFVAHAASGALATSGAAVTATANRDHIFPTVGALTGAGAAADGTAHRTHAHATSGAVHGSDGALTGSAARTHAHATSGVLAGVHGAVTSAAHRARSHSVSGAMTGTGRLLVASAHRANAHMTTAVLRGAGAKITSGKVNHHQGHHKHSSGSSLTGSGGLIGQGSRLTATAALSARHEHPTLGTLTTAHATVSAAATRQHSHAASGALVPNAAATLGTSGIIARSTAKEHVTAGAVRGAQPSITASAHRQGAWDTTGEIISDESLLEGFGIRYRQHSTAGSLSGTGTVVTGKADRARPQRRVYQRTEAQRVRARREPLAKHCASHASLAHLRTEQAMVWANPSIQVGYAFSRQTMIHTHTQRPAHVEPQEHATTGGLVGTVGHVAGNGVRNVSHGTAGILAGAGSSVAGTSYRASQYPLFSANTEIILMTYGAADGGATIGGQGTTSVTNSINGGTSAATNIFANEFVAGGLIRVRWGAGVERGLPGVYTWSGVNAQVNALKAFGKKFWILVDTQTWANVGQSWVPDYIRADEITYGGTTGHGGEVLKNGATGAYGVIWWNANVYARWLAFINALGAQYASDPSFGGLMIGESSISYDSATTAAAGGVLFFEQNYKNMMTDAAAAMGSKNLVYPNVNFLPGSNGTQTGALNTWLSDNGYNGGTELEFPVTPLPLYPANTGSNSSANYDASGVAGSLATWPSDGGQRVYAFTDGTVQWGVNSGFTTDMAERIMNYASYLGVNLVSFNTVFVSGDGLPINQQWTNGYGPLVKTGYLRQ